jgi:threonine/homoserine/homoserine lactone efflux protein
MTPDQDVAFLTFAVVAAITPGPSSVMITATGSAVGLLRGLPCALGAAVGMASLLFCVALGLGKIVVALPMLLKVMNLCGAGFLLWLAWKVATAGPVSRSNATAAVGFVGAALFQWANPKGWLVAVSAAGTYLQASEINQLLQAATFGGLFFAAALPCGLSWLAFGALLQTALRDQRKARIFNIVMGLALATSILMIFR